MRTLKNNFKFKTVEKFRAVPGFTLIELLICIAILSIIMIGLHQPLVSSLSAYDNTKTEQELLAQARFAMERMVMFFQETDYVSKPDDVYQEILRINERELDTYNNADNTYTITGDSILDADNDSDGLINEDTISPDPPDLITFDLDKTDGSNWKLREQIPDYGTAALDDFKAYTVICEHVKAFKCSRLSPDLVEIELVLDNGNGEVRLKTRAKARFMK